MLCRHGWKFTNSNSNNENNILKKLEKCYISYLFWKKYNNYFWNLFFGIKEYNNLSKYSWEYNHKNKMKFRK